MESDPTQLSDDPGLVALREAKEKHETPLEDIDPHAWLSHDDTAVFGYVDTRAGRLRIAALSETETDLIRRGCTKPVNPGNPRGGTRMDLKAIRLMTVATSLNKAYGFERGNSITPEQIEANKKLSGEITLIVNKISEISGYQEEPGQNLDQFPSIS